MLILILLIFKIQELKASEDLKIVKKKPVLKEEVKLTKKPKNKATQVDSSKINELLKLSKTTNDLLGKFQERSGIWDFSSEFDFKTGTVVKGILLNSIVSTNLESPVLIEVIEDSKLPKNSLFSCKGVTKYQRVLTACNRLIIPSKDEEFQIQAGVLNLDGSAGIKPDEVYTGKEEYVAATIATAFSKGLIEMNTERLASPLGELTPNTSKNRILNGVMESMNETNDLMKNEMQNKEPKIYVKAGRQVLIYFFERFKI